jgi:hypothetical protein
VLQCFLDCPSKNHCPNGTTAHATLRQQAPQIKGKALKSSNMEALKESMQAKGRAKVGDAVRRRMGKPAKEEATPRTSRPTPSSRRTAH